MIRHMTTLRLTNSVRSACVTVCMRCWLVGSCAGARSPAHEHTRSLSGNHVGAQGGHQECGQCVACARGGSRALTTACAVSEEMQQEAIDCATQVRAVNLAVTRGPPRLCGWRSRAAGVQEMSWGAVLRRARSQRLCRAAERPSSNQLVALLVATVWPCGARGEQQLASPGGGRSGRPASSGLAHFLPSVARPATHGTRLGGGAACRRPVASECTVNTQAASQTGLLNALRELHVPASAHPPATRKRPHGRTLLHASDWNLLCASSQALEKYNIEKDIASYIKKEFDKKFGPTWHCIVGRIFGACGCVVRAELSPNNARWRTLPGSFVTHETKHFLYMYLGQVAVLLFKSG